MKTCCYCDEPVAARGLCRHHYTKAWNQGEHENYAVVLGTKPLQERLLEKVQKNPITGCWNWVGNRNDYGYGLLWRDRRSRRAHRIAFELFNGPVSDDEVVCHRCDNPRCVNPEHLFKGMVFDNNQDTARKGRHRMGLEHHAAKLSDDDVRAILASSNRVGDLARIYGVHQSTISKLRSGARRRATLRADHP